MRDNGLPAQAWTHLADVDAWYADAVLDALRAAGVAAYVTPHPGRTGPYLDVAIPDRPTDRLYVATGSQEQAATVLAALAAGAGRQAADPPRTPAEVDAAFAAIVAGYHAEPGGLPPTSPEDAGEVGGGPVGWADLLRGEPAEAPAETESADRYLPPPPPPVPHGTPLRRFAWAAVIGAPLVVALCVLLSYELEGWSGLLIVAAFVAGLVTLFATMPDRPPDDGDDGAVV